MIELAIDKASAIYIGGREELTAGRVGLTIAAKFSADWSGLTKVAVVSGSGKSLDAAVDADGVFTVPHECMETPGGQLKVGIYGMSEDGKIIIPTVYCVLGIIRDGALPAGETETEPTPSVFNQIVNLANTAAEKAQTARTEAESASESAAASASDAASAKTAAEEAQTAAETAAKDAGAYRKQALSSASAAASSATKAQRAIDNAKFVSVNVDDDGHLYFSRTEAAEDVNITMEEGRLVLTIE